MLHYELSFFVALLTQARPHHCYANAWRALLTLPDLFEQDGCLVEGWMVVDLPHQVCVIEHGWCIRAQQQVVDPTVVLTFNKRIPLHFFAGNHYTWAEVALLRCEHLPFVRTAGHYGSDGLGHPEYRQAYQNALALAHTLANASGKVITIQPSVESEASLTASAEEVASSDTPLVRCSKPHRLAVFAIPAHLWARGQHVPDEQAKESAERAR